MVVVVVVVVVLVMVCSTCVDIYVHWHFLMPTILWLGFGWLRASGVGLPVSNTALSLVDVVICRHGSLYLCGHLHTLAGLMPNMYSRQKTGYLELELADWKDQRV